MEKIMDPEKAKISQRVWVVLYENLDHCRWYWIAANLDVALEYEAKMKELGFVNVDIEIQAIHEKVSWR